MSGRHRASTRRPWWQRVRTPRRRGLRASHPVRDDPPGTSATVLLGAAGLAGVLVGSTLDAAPGTVVMAVSAVVPGVVLGGALARTRTALAHEGRRRRRLAGDLAVSDETVRRLGERVGVLVDRGLDDAAELGRTRSRLRRAQDELAVARLALQAAEAVPEVVGSPAGRPPTARVAGPRSVASVDLRVFDAFTEADLAVEDAVLDAPVRRGRHAATLDLSAVTAPAGTAGQPRLQPRTQESDVA